MFSMSLMFRKEQFRLTAKASTPVSARRDHCLTNQQLLFSTDWMGTKDLVAQRLQRVLVSHWFLEFWLHTLGINASRSSSPGLSDEQSGRIISSIRSKTTSTWKVSSPRHCSGVSHGLFGLPFLLPVSSFPTCSEKILKLLPHGAGTQSRKSPNNLFDIPWCPVTSSRWVDAMKLPDCIQTLHSQHSGLFQTHITCVRLSGGSSPWTESLAWFQFAERFSQQPTRLLLSIQHFIFYTEINDKIPVIFKGTIQPWVRMQCISTRWKYTHGDLILVRFSVLFF